MRKTDFLIVGAGIAGAGMAYRLAGYGDILVCDMEAQADYHTTGRSAAFYAETYGGDKIQPLTSCSKDFLRSPPMGFSEAPLITDLGAIFVFDASQKSRAVERFEATRKKLPHVQMLDQDELSARVPQLADGRFLGGIYDSECGNLDVSALHQGYLRAAKKMGAELLLGADFESAVYNGSVWTVKLRGHTVQAKFIVNCAGAWGDQIADRSGLAPIGLTPLRRTLVTIPNPEPLPFDKNLPVIFAFDEDFYFKTEGKGYLVSPADETLSPPSDCQPEMEDVAIAVDHFERATGSTVKTIEAKWAGLRTFAPDRAPVIGLDPASNGFFWNVGQGGYGIQTSPAWSRLATSLILGHGMPDDIKRQGADFNWYSPARFA